MYTRGQFALIGKTTIKALRIYDEMGLLKPERIDVNNQYKYYSQTQVDEIILINELKSFGFSLNEIKKIKENRSSSYLKECFSKRLAELDMEIKEANSVKERLRGKLNDLNEDEAIFNNTSHYSVDLVEIDEMVVVSCRKKVNIQDVGMLIGKVYEQICSFSLEALDSHMLIFHDDDLDSQSSDWDIEVCVPVNKNVKAEGFSTKIIERNTYARTLHTGGFSNVGKAHAAVIDWIKGNGYKINGAPMEKYLTAKQAAFNPTSFETEVYYPVQQIK
ncbi:MerR family transcriptional regulator [Clostridium oryzae]|uniref:Multidrug-efflux transporter 1 regulator n=1 Tax=Clostridium oryzae TaxID=1450648 RepID=A0A1V4IEY5_9CLOT|nr:MerR family transcriptional regulator [Clostridium oryzae]OPJ58205.1 multidrug-efflux transporter 1 regulator [Clostridium oryzae]